MKNWLRMIIIFGAAGGGNGGIDASALPQLTDPGTNFVQAGIKIILTIAGAIAVLMMVIGGIKYAGSQGDPSGVAKAKDTILYALVGLIVAILATVIVDYIYTLVTKQ